MRRDSRANSAPAAGSPGAAVRLGHGPEGAGARAPRGVQAAAPSRRDGGRAERLPCASLGLSGEERALLTGLFFPRDPHFLNPDSV